MASAASTPPQSVPTGSKFLLGLIPLIIFGGIGFYVFLPHYLATHKSPEQEAIARTLDDVERAKKLVAIAVFEKAPAAADGRVDIYRPLLATIRDENELVALCSRLDRGPTLEEIRAGDYARFPYQRAEGGASMENGQMPVFWDREPTAGGNRILALSDCSVHLVSENRLQGHLLRFGLK